TASCLVAIKRSGWEPTRDFSFGRGRVCDVFLVPRDSAELRSCPWSRIATPTFGTEATRDCSASRRTLRNSTLPAVHFWTRASRPYLRIAKAGCGLVRQERYIAGRTLHFGH